jgi:uncharacterized protein YcbK (DUF882 family)
MKYFKYSEFDSPDFKGSGKEKMSKEFLDMLDFARELAGIPFKINSGYRTPLHNTRVGGSSTSSHLNGIAADISCTDNGSRLIMLNALISAGFNRIGMAKTFIHVDIDKNKMQNRIWLY